MGRTDYRTVRPPEDVEKRRRWLLRDGRVVTQEPYYTTPARRRVMATPDGESLDRTQVSEVLARAIEIKHGSLWLYLGIPDDLYSIEAWEMPKPTGFHVLNDNHATEIIWRYTHPTLPIPGAVRLLAKTGKEYQHGQHVMKHTGAVTLLYPSGTRRIATNILEPPTETDIPFGEYDFGNERALARFILDVAAIMGDVATIEIPDTRGRYIRGDRVEIPDDEDARLTLEFDETNYTPELSRELRAYLDSDGAAAEMLEHYRAMLDVARRLGIVLPSMEENDFERALVGDLSALTAETRGVKDVSCEDPHGLDINLITGAIAVRCPYDPLDQLHGDDLEHYEIVKLKLELTGELDEALEYVRAKRELRNEKRIKEVHRQAEAQPGIIQ